MPPLIPAQVIADLLNQQHNANSPTQADPNLLDDIYHPARQLQIAQALRRQRTASAAGLPNGRAPLADHVRQAKTAGTQGTVAHDFSSQPAQTNPQAGTMSIGPGSGQPHTDLEGRQLAARPAMSPEALREGMYRAVQTYNPQHQANGPVRGMPGDASGASGFQVSGLGPQQAPDPVVNAIMAYKGHVADHELTAAQQAANAGEPIGQVIGRLHAASQSQAGEQGRTAHESAVEQRQAKNDTFSQNVRRLDEARHLLDEITSKDAMLKSGNTTLMQQSPNFAKAQKLQSIIADLQGQVIGGNEQQQQQQQPQQPQHPERSALTWNGQQFSAGQSVRGANGRVYKLTGRLHPDGSPEVVPQ